MPRAGFEPAIPMFKRSKRVRSLDRAAIGNGLHYYTHKILIAFLPVRIREDFFMKGIQNMMGSAICLKIISQEFRHKISIPFYIVMVE
jgi:hypothetical protein